MIFFRVHANSWGKAFSALNILESKLFLVDRFESSEEFVFFFSVNPIYQHNGRLSIWPNADKTINALNELVSNGFISGFAKIGEDEYEDARSNTGSRSHHPVQSDIYSYRDDEVSEMLKSGGISEAELNADMFEAARNEERLSGGTFSLSLRNIAYPFSFDTDFKQRFLSELPPEKRTGDGRYICQGCNKPLCFDDVTLDHIKPLARIFNSCDYLKSRGERRNTFFCKDNLQVMCRSCNSQKRSEGVKYEQSLIHRMITEGKV